MNLTENAVEMICNGGAPEEGFKPVVQVADLKLLTAAQNNNNERYRMLISDGKFIQQGMLATQMNSLVHQGKLQKGSVVQLSQFVSQVIQQRKIIIIIELNVILEKCDPIGEPKQYAQGGAGGSPAPQSGMTSVNSQSYGGGSFSSGPVPGQHAIGRAPMQHPVPDPGSNPQPYGSSYAANPDLRSYGATNGPPRYPKSEPGGSLPVSAPLAGGYNGQSRSFLNSDVEAGSRAPFNSYGRPQQAAYQQPPAMYMNRGPVARNEAPARIIPISALNPYQGRWTIKARVTSKKELRRYNNARGEGKVFSFDLLDSEGGEIKVTCFNNVADQFYNQIEAGRVYLISKGTLKQAQKNFNQLNNDHEIHLESTSTIQPCMEDDVNIPRQQFHFRSISDIESMSKDAIVDLIGVVSSINLTASIIKKDGTETLKRTLQLKDMSGRSVEITFWGNFCNAEGQELQNKCDAGVFPVLAIKAGRVNDFNGKSVGTIASSQLFIDPDFPEASKLKEWFDREGKNALTISISRDAAGMGKQDVRKAVSQIKDERLGTSEKPDWITVNATISFIKTDSFCYTGCPLMIGDRQCNKKVANNGDGHWRCERCDQTVEQCDYRYLLQFQIQDHTGLTWVTAFQESGEDIMGISAKDLFYLKYEEQDEEKFSTIIRNVLFSQYLLKLKVKEEIYGDEQRVKSTVVKAERLDYKTEAKFLIDLMDKVAEDPNLFCGKAANGVPDSGMNNFGHQNAGMRQGAAGVSSMGSNMYAARDAGVMANQVAPFGNQYNSARGPATVGTGVSVYCDSCGGSGHNAKNCPSISSRPGQPMGGGYVNRPLYGGAVNGGGADKCFKCDQFGHWAKDCPGPNNRTSVYGSGSGDVNVRYGGVPKQRY